MNPCGVMLCVVLSSGVAMGQVLNCNLDRYKPSDGIRAEVKGEA